MIKTSTPRYTKQRATATKAAVSSTSRQPVLPPKVLAAPGFTIKGMPAGVSLITYNRQTTDSGGGVITNTPLGLFDKKAMRDLPDSAVDGLRPLVLVELPRGGPSDFVDHLELLATYQRRLPKLQRRIMLQWTIYAADPLLTLWDEVVRARAFATLIASELGVPSVLIQHVPANAGFVEAAHIHILILPRMLSRDGFGATADRLIADETGQILSALWTQFLASWS